MSIEGKGNFTRAISRASEQQSNDTKSRIVLDVSFPSF